MTAVSVVVVAVVVVAVVVAVVVVVNGDAVIIDRKENTT